MIKEIKEIKKKKNWITTIQTKNCSFANCTSDIGLPEENVIFIPFVKPHVGEVSPDKWGVKENGSG